MRILIDNIITINDPSEDMIKYFNTELIINNPEYTKKQRMGLWLGDTPQKLKLFNYINKWVYQVPIGCYKDISKYFDENTKIEDVRVEVASSKYSTSMVLREYQQLAVMEIMKHKNGIIEMFASAGKTQTGLFASYLSGQKTLWITHTKDLLDQASKRALSYSNDIKVSYITEGKCDVSGDIVFATVQTLYRTLDISKIEKHTFGMIIVDECHRISINADSMNMFRKCCDYFSSKYKIGLTATLHRSDRLVKGIFCTLGDSIYEIKKDVKKNIFIVIVDGKEIYNMPIGDFQVPVEVLMVRSGYNIRDKEYLLDHNGVLDFTKLISDMAVDTNRNMGIINLLNQIPKEAYTLVLSLRLSQLETLFEGVNTDKKVLIKGSTKKESRRIYLDQMRDGESHVMFATYNLAKEGLDIPRLQYLVLALPCKDFAVVTQSLGRIQRIYDGKDRSYVIDIIDDVGILLGFTSNRKSIYKKSGYFFHEI